ncbi:hypothetical protein [Endothiovibrio diazotrophicus]
MSEQDLTPPASVDSETEELDERPRWSRPKLTAADIGPSTQHSNGPIYTDGSFAPKAS